MAETFEEIIKEIDRCKYICEYFGVEKGNCEICSQHKNCFRSFSKSIASRVREAVGGDPSEWWVECNGERVKVGDKVEAYSNEYEVFALGPERVIYDNGYHFDSVRADLVHKVIPDTREKIVADTVDKLIKTANMSADKMREIIGAAVDRGAKLPGVDA